MSKFLLNTVNSPTDQIISLTDVEFLKLSAETLVAVSEPVDACPSDDYLLIADQDENNIWSTSWMLKTEYLNIQKNRRLSDQMKIKRNQLIAATDWTQNADVSNTVSFAWQPYRDALRNVTKQEGFPTNIVWPTPPTEFPEVTIAPTGIQGPKGDTGAQGIQGVAGVGIKGIASGYVDAGQFITLDNIKATVTTTGNRGLSVATVSGTMVLAISANYSTTGGGNGHSTQWPGATYTTTPSGSWFGYHFPNAGDGSTYLCNDYANQRFYRIHLMIGPGYIKNFISIERLA